MKLVTQNKVYYGDYTCYLDKIIDGDTIKCRKVVGLPALIGENINVRLRAVDAPELRARSLKEKSMAKYVKTRLEAFIDEKIAFNQQVELQRVGRGKYFRLVADIYVGNESLSQFLLREKLGCSYRGGKREKLAQYIKNNTLDCPL